MVTALTRRDSDPSLLVNWALRFLEEKKHSIGESVLNTDHKRVIAVDGKDLLVAESGDIVNLASGYDDWPQRYAQFGEWIQEHMGHK
jgi:hypothetical protein